MARLQFSLVTFADESLLGLSPFVSPTPYPLNLPVDTMKMEKNPKKRGEKTAYVCD